MESEIIIEEWSPLGNIQAFVEKTARTYYFYLWINPATEASEIRSCWICNRIKAPHDVKEALAIEGQEPCMPIEFVGHDPDGIDMDETNLSVQWFEEADAAALLSENRLLAVIPYFSGFKGAHGYSLFAKGMGPFAWELKPAYTNFETKVKESKEFWDYFDTEYWSNAQESYINSLLSFFGKYEKYYAIDGGKFPPKALVTGRKHDISYAFTLGVSMIPMPTVEMAYGEAYKKFRRMELGFAGCIENEDTLKRIFSAMSSLTTIPWHDLTYLGHGHTIPFNGVQGFKYILLLNTNIIDQIDAPQYGEFMGEEINLLWIRLITEEEYDFLVDKGVAEYLKGKNMEDIHINFEYGKAETI